MKNLGIILLIIGLISLFGGLIKPADSNVSVEIIGYTIKFGLIIGGIFLMSKGSNQKPIVSEKENSLLSLSEVYKCNPNQVKLKFFDELKNNKTTAIEAQNLIKEMGKKQYEESQLLNIEPNNTPSALKKEWLEEYIKEKVYADRKRETKEVIADHLSENPELAKAVYNGNKSEIKKIIHEKPDLLNSYMENMVYAEKPAERYRIKAVNLVYKINSPTPTTQNEYLEAIQLINKGLEINEPETEPFLYALRAECYVKIGKSSNGIIDLNQAISFLKKVSPENYRQLAEFHKDLFDIYFSEKDYANAEKVINSALKIIESEAKNYMIKALCLKKRAELYKTVGKTEFADMDIKESKEQARLYDEDPDKYASDFDY